MTNAPHNINVLNEQIKTCRLCVDHPQYLPPLPVQPRPVVCLSDKAKIAISGQAPGLRVFESGVPFNDRSGDRLREWLGVKRESFYNKDYFAIVPMGLCFPGYDKNGHDLPPRKECAKQWHENIFAAMPQIELVLAIGGYAQKWHIDGIKQAKVNDIVHHWQTIFQQTQSRGYHVIPLPHPSWRNTGWLKRNPWFEQKLLPVMRQEVKKRIDN